MSKFVPSLIIISPMLLHASNHFISPHSDKNGVWVYLKKHIAQNLLTSVRLIECENFEGISSPLMNLSEVKKLYQDN